MPDTNVNYQDDLAPSANDTARPAAPAGMTYNRKGVLVKQRKQSARNNKVFVVMQLINDDGSVMTDIGKRHVKVLKTERNSDKVLEIIDSGEYDGAFYLRLDLSSK